MSCPESSNYTSDCGSFTMSFRTDPAVTVIDRKYVLSNTTEEWNNFPELVAKENYIYVYTDYATTIIDEEEVNVPGLKIGDGTTLLIDLPFVDAHIKDLLDLKAPLDSPNLTGIPTAPDITDTSLDDQIVNKGYVDNKIIEGNFMVKGVDYVTAGQNTDFTIGFKATAEGQDSVAYGEKSHAEGSDTMALGVNSHAEGYGNKIAVVLTGGSGSTTLSYDDSYAIPAVGDIIFCESSGLSSRVSVVNTINNTITLDNRIALRPLSSSTDTYIVTGAAVADCSHVEGKNNVANGYSSHAEGEETKAYGVYSHAEGYATQAGSGTPSGGLYSHAEGLRTKAIANSSHTEGAYTEASGSASHSEGNNTSAQGNYSHAEGSYTRAIGRSQHVFGEYNIAENGTASTRGNYVEIVGNGTADDVRSNARTLDWNGNETLAGKLTVGVAPDGSMDVTTKKYVDDKFMAKGIDYVTAGRKSGTTLGTNATAEGYSNTASGMYSHAEGAATIASGNYSHAEGQQTTASSSSSHAEGSNTSSSGDGSHAEGEHTTASSLGSHAEGYRTTASGGYGSHAEGQYAVASGTNSHAEGYYTTAQRKSQHVFGEYNILDASGSTSTRGDYVEIVGNGASNNSRSNARTLDWFGNEVLAGKLTIGASPTGDMDVTPKTYVDTALALKANLASPTFTGSPKAPTPSTGDNSTNIATTAFVQNTITARLVSLADTNAMLDSVFNGV